MGEGEEGMTQKEAIELWNTSIQRLMEQCTEYTKFGCIALGWGLHWVSKYPSSSDKAELTKIANKLREWADALEGKDDCIK